MSENKHPYNDFFQEKLGNHESSLSEDLFHRLMSDRSMRQNLDDHETPVKDDLFNQMMRKREGSDEQPSDAPLRERLVEHPSAVPKSTFNQVIVERERRRRVLAWRSGAAILLFFVTYLSFINRDSLFDNREVKTESSINQPEGKSQVENSLNQQKEDKSIADSKENSIVENNLTIENRDKTIDNRHDLVVNSNDETVVNNNQLQKVTHKSKNTVQRTPFGEGGDVDMSVDKKQKAIKQQSLSTHKRYKAVSNSTNLITENIAPQQAIIPGAITASSAVESGDKGVDNKGLSPDNRIGFNFSLSTPYASDFDQLSVLKVKNIALPTKNSENPCAGPGDGCPTFGKKRQRGDNGKSIYIDIYGAPEYAFRRLSENLPEKSTYLQARDTVERPWYAFSAGARVSLVLSNGLALRTGFAYAQTNEIAVFDSLGVGKKVTTETYVPRTGGGQDTIRKTEITSGIFRTTNYNRYRSIDIPLQIGFELPINDYWTFSVNGGANFNISSWRKATILSEKGNRQDVSSGFGETNPVFNNTLGISVFGSVGAYRQLTGNLQLVIEPSVRHYFQPMTRSDYALKQAYTNAGLMLGLRYRL